MDNPLQNGAASPAGLTPVVGRIRVDLSKLPHLLPEETLPGGEVGALKKRVLQNAFHSPQSLDDICPVIVQIPAQTSLLFTIKEPDPLCI